MKKGGQSEGEGRIINDIQVSSLGDRKENHGNRSVVGGLEKTTWEMLTGSASEYQDSDIQLGNWK